MSSFTDTVSVVLPNGDTLRFASDMALLDNETAILPTPIPIDLVGRLVFFTDTLLLDFFFWGCWRAPSCGMHYTHSRQERCSSFTIITDSVGLLRIDLQAYFITDTVEIVLGSTTLVKLGVGGQNLTSGGPMGPFIWYDHHITEFRGDSLASFPYFLDYGVEIVTHEGLAVFFITIPDSICTVTVNICGNIDAATVWDAFVHCAPLQPKPLFTDTIQLQRCDPGLLTYAPWLPPIHVFQDTIVTIVNYLHGCKYQTDYLISVVPTPQVDISVTDLTCENEPFLLHVVRDDLRDVSLCGHFSRFRQTVLPCQFAVLLDSAHVSLDLTDMVTVEDKLITVLVEAQGCRDTLIIDTRSSCEVYLPTAFSPNDDGINDFFYPMTYHGVENLTIIRFSVFDRWGGMVFNQENFPPNSTRHAWDGRSGDPGVYVWILSALLPNGEINHLSGEITLVR
jgi:gliding motility-associated-like protein